MRGRGSAHTLVLAAGVAASAVGCAQLDQAITGRDLACPDSDTSLCIALADAAVQTLDPALAPSVTRIELADTPCDSWQWWRGEAIPANVDQCWEVMAATADGWRRGIVVRFADGTLHAAW